MKAKIAWASVAVVLAAGFFLGQRPEPTYLQGLRWIERADPVEDAKKALTSGDHRLRAVNGLGILIPGTDPKEFGLFKRDYGINPIAGTTDALANEEHYCLVQMAIKYSETYNRTIIAGYRPQAHP